MRHSLLVFRALTVNRSVACLVFALAACASVPEDAGFADAAQLARERAGLELRWRRGGSEDAALDARVRELLDAGLGADSAVEVALLSNRRLQALYAELGFAQADLLAASRLPNPLLHAEARFPSGGGKSLIDLGLEQDFLGVLFLPLKKRLAGDEFEAVKLRVAEGALALAGEARAAFYRLQGAGQLLELRKTSLEAAEAALELAQRLREAGNVRALEVDLERAQREEARLRVGEAELQESEAREELVRTLGLSGRDAELPAVARLPDLPATAGETSGLEARALEQSLALAATRHEIERAARALGLTRDTRLFPAVGWGAGAERDEVGWSAGPALSASLPLFSLGTAGVRRASAELARLQETYAADAVELASRVRASAGRVGALRARAAFLHDTLIPLRAGLVEQLLLEYNAMQEGAFRLIAAKRDELEAGSAYVSSLADYWVARAELDGMLAGAGPRADERATSSTSIASFFSPPSSH